MPTDDFGRHELLDRVYLIAEMFEQYVLDHPASKEDPEIQAQVERLSEGLYALYGQVGRVFAAHETSDARSRKA
jgi:hypothetical protein